MYYYIQSEINYACPVNIAVLERLKWEGAGYDLNAYRPTDIITLLESFLLCGGFSANFSYQENHECNNIF